MQRISSSSLSRARARTPPANPSTDRSPRLWFADYFVERFDIQETSIPRELPRNYRPSLRRLLGERLPNGRKPAADFFQLSILEPPTRFEFVKLEVEERVSFDEFNPLLILSMRHSRT